MVSLLFHDRFEEQASNTKVFPQLHPKRAGQSEEREIVEQEALKKQQIKQSI